MYKTVATLKINNDIELYNKCKAERKNFGQYAEKLFCDAFNLEFIGTEKHRHDARDNANNIFEIKSFNITIASSGKARYSAANGIGTNLNKNFTIKQHINYYCDSLDYLVLIEGNIQMKKLTINILNKETARDFLFDNIAITTDKNADKTKIAYHNISEPQNYRQAMRYKTIIEKGYTLE